MLTTDSTSPISDHMLLQSTIPQPKKLTRRKLWGYYIHALLTHALLQYRLISLRQLNAENEERLFGSLKDTTLRTLSRWPGEIIYKAFIKRAASMHLTNTIVTKEKSWQKYPHH